MCYLKHSSFQIKEITCKFWKQMHVITNAFLEIRNTVMHCILNTEDAGIILDHFVNSSVYRMFLDNNWIPFKLK